MIKDKNYELLEKKQGLILFKIYSKRSKLI